MKGSYKHLAVFIFIIGVSLTACNLACGEIDFNKSIGEIKSRIEALNANGELSTIMGNKYGTSSLLLKLLASAENLSQFDPEFALELAICLENSGLEIISADLEKLITKNGKNFSDRDLQSLCKVYLLHKYSDKALNLEQYFEADYEKADMVLSVASNSFWLGDTENGLRLLARADVIISKVEAGFEILPMLSYFEICATYKLQDKCKSIVNKIEQLFKSGSFNQKFYPSLFFATKLFEFDNADKALEIFNELEAGLKSISNKELKQAYTTEIALNLSKICQRERADRFISEHNLPSNIVSPVYLNIARRALLNNDKGLVKKLLPVVEENLKFVESSALFSKVMDYGSARQKMKNNGFITATFSKDELVLRLSECYAQLGEFEESSRTLGLIEDAKGQLLSGVINLEIFISNDSKVDMNNLIEKAFTIAKQNFGSDTQKMIDTSSMEAVEIGMAQSYADTIIKEHLVKLAGFLAKQGKIDKSLEITELLNDSFSLKNAALRQILVQCVKENRVETAEVLKKIISEIDESNNDDEKSKALLELYKSANNLNLQVM